MPNQGAKFYYTFIEEGNAKCCYSHLKALNGIPIYLFDVSVDFVGDL